MPAVICQSEEKVVLWLLHARILQPGMPTHTLATASARLQGSLDRLQRAAIGLIKPTGNTDVLPPLRLLRAGDSRHLLNL